MKPYYRSKGITIYCAHGAHQHDAPRFSIHMKPILLFLLSLGLHAQATFTQGSKPTAAVPSQLVANSPDGSVKCTLTGDTFPATKVNFSCTVAGTAGFVNGPIPFPAGAPFFALTLQINSGTNANTLMVSLTPGTNGIALQATVNGSTPATGTF